VGGERGRGVREGVAAGARRGWKPRWRVRAFDDLRRLVGDILSPGWNDSFRDEREPGICTARRSRNQDEDGGWRIEDGSLGRKSCQECANLRYSSTDEHGWKPGFLIPGCGHQSVRVGRLGVGGRLALAPAFVGLRRGKPSLSPAGTMQTSTEGNKENGGLERRRGG
jgi:hypothetical protein